MSAHKFRYLLPPGNNFNFVSKFRTWVVISILLMSASVAMLFVNKARHGAYMNWTIDFKGGTELIFAFTDNNGAYTRPDPAVIRKALADAGEEAFDVSDFSYDEKSKTDPEKKTEVHGTIIRTPRFAAVKPDAEAAVKAAFIKQFSPADPDLAASWSGDRLYVHGKKLIKNEEAAPVFQAAGLELKPWTEQDAAQYTHPDEAKGEYAEVFVISGLERQFSALLDKALPGTHSIVVNSYGVSAKAGDKLRDDAFKSVVYAIFLIMLYLAVRFDIRYAPGAAFATIHDAIMVIGVFALTWQEVSLVSVAGLLTVMGYSVNDTVIVFDRIRENQAKLKDKKIERIIDISINEMLVRTILTSSTVFATTLIMNIFGSGLVKNFAFAMNIGVIVGTYSSIFLAAPLFMWVSKQWYSGPAKRRRGVVVEPVVATASATDSEPEE